MNRRELLGTIGLMSAALPTPQAAFGNDHAAATGGKHMAPVGNHHLHFCGIHVAKNDPKFQIITQHYCGPLGEEMHQCLLYDSLEKQAKLVGVEYIISNKIFQTLPEEEKKFWHPHTYEVLAGGLIAPGMSPDDEMNFMKGLLTTWGKTWHTWPDPKTAVPMGTPLLMWSLTGDGQSDPRVVEQRDKQFGVSTSKVREKRVETIGLEPPQIPPPPSLNTIGRQWTATGEDKPIPHKK